MIKSLKYVSSLSLDGLEKIVFNLLNEGWELYGNLVVLPESDRFPSKYFQTMILPDKVKPLMEENNE